MKWFKHMTDMSADPKIKRAIRKYGMAAYGMYNIIIERISKNLTSNNPIPDFEETADDIASEFNMDIRLVNEIMSFLLNQGLFSLDEITGRILCHKIYKFIDKSQTTSKNILEMLNIYRKKIESEDVMINHDKSCNIMLEQNRTEQNKTEQNNINVSQKMRNDKYIKLSKLLYEKHKENDENYLLGKNLDKIFDKWSNDIRLLVEKDKREYDIVKEVIKWCQTPGNFWVPNILSGKKLREKFDTLLMQYKQNGNNQKKEKKEESEWMKKYKSKLNKIAEFDPSGIEIDDSIFEDI